MVVRRLCSHRSHLQVQKRFFSSVVENELEDDDGIDFPYAFLNKDELVPKPKGLDAPMKKSFTTFLEVKQTQEEIGVEQPCLKDVFSAHYVNLLEAIAQRETADLRKICEGNLYRAFMEGLEDLNEQSMKVEVMRPFDLEDL